MQVAVISPVRLVADVVTMTAGEEEMYPPFDRPQIMTELAKVAPGDKDSALLFAERWGLLGFAQLLTQRRTIPAPFGDPVPWIWAHANGVSAVLQLLNALADAPGTIKDVLREVAYSGERLAPAAVDVNDKLKHGQIANLCGQAEPLFGSGRKAAAIRSTRGGVLVRLPVYGRREEIAAGGELHDSDIERVARRIINLVINDNLIGISPALTAGDPPRMSNRWDAVISVVYLHLANAAAGKTIRECKFCGMFFLQTHGRQRYCPPRDAHAGESYCATKKRVAEFRTKGKGARK